MENLPAIQYKEIVYGELIDDKVQEFINNNQQLSMMQNTISNQLVSFNKIAQNIEITNLRYLNAENNRQSIINYENAKYYELMQKQNNLLDRINFLEIKLWRFKNLLYFRTNGGQLIINNIIEIQKELSSRYGSDVRVVNDLNDVLRNNEQFRVNTIFIAINNIVVVEQEVFIINLSYELVKLTNEVWERNLLAYTRFNKKNYTVKYDYQKCSFTRSLMHFLVENLSNNTQESISCWIGNIGLNIDTMLLLVGNQSVSEDLVVNKVIQSLFDTNLVVTITDEILSQNFEEIANRKLFIHINHVPNGEENQQKLKELIFSILINKSIQSNGHKIPTQAKIIVTIDEAHVFFRDFLEISTTLFIDSKENILKKSKSTSITSLYQSIEASLDYYSEEIKVMPKDQQDIRVNENQRYLDSLIETNDVTEDISQNGIPILNPFNDSFNSLVQKYNRIHTLIMGGSGAGKTEQVKTNIYCDILREDGSVIVIDPHGDFAKDILSLPMDKDRIVFIDPALKDDMTPTINIFENKEKNISEKDIKLKANIIISVVKAINDEEKFSSSMKEMLYHCICVLLRKGDSSFKELLDFMNDKKNTKLVELGLQSPNELDREYFEDYFNSGSSKQTKDALRRRLKTLLSDHYFSNLVNGKSTFDLEELMNTKGKVIIINVNKHNMPEHYGYFTRFIIELIQKIAFNRANMPKESRIPTYCYIDECGSFLTAKIEEILTEVRKFNLLMTFSFQSIMQVKNITTRNIIVSNTNTKFFGKDDNGVPEVFKNILTKEAIEKIPNLNVGKFYLKANNQDLIPVQNSDVLLNGKVNLSIQALEEIKQSQLIYCRPIKPTVSQPTEEDINEMIKQFKADLISKNLTETSCLYKLKTSAPERFKEIKNDFEFRTPKDNECKPRIRQQEISTIFQLAFELNELISNRKFISQLKNENVADMFNQTDSGTRSAEFTDNGKSNTENYYYL